MRSNKDYRRLTQGELDEELAALEDRLSTTGGASRVKTLFQNLRIHQIELEMQNRELRETLNTLDDVRDRFADLYDFAPIGYMTLDNRGIVREINLTGARMLGRPRTELYDRPLVPRLEPGYSRAFFTHLDRIFDTPVKATVELALRARSREKPWVMLESVRVRSGNETVCRTAMIDVTERRNIEADLRRTEEKLWRMTDAVPVLISYIDADMRYRSANSTHRQWLGLNPERMIGRRVHELMDPDRVAVLMPFAERALEGEEVTFENTVMHGELGLRRVKVTLIPDQDSNGLGKGFFSVITDITVGGERPGS